MALQDLPDLPSVWWPTTRIAGASKGFSKSCARLCRSLYASYNRSLPLLKALLLLSGLLLAPLLTSEVPAET